VLKISVSGSQPIPGNLDLSMYKCTGDRKFYVKVGEIHVAILSVVIAKLAMIKEDAGGRLGSVRCGIGWN